MFLSHFKNGSKKFAAALLFGLLLGVTTPACGGDDDEPEVKDKTEQPDTPATPDTPDEPQEPQPSEPDEPIVPSVPDRDIAEEELLGFWQAEKVQEDKYFWNGSKWVFKNSETSVRANSDKFSWWFSYVTILRYNGKEMFFINLFSRDIEKLYNLLDTKGTGGCGDGLGKVYVENGRLSGDNYTWIWYNDTKTFVTKKGSKVYQRWKITNLTEDSFDAYQELNVHELGGADLKMYQDLGYTNYHIHYERSTTATTPVDYVTPKSENQ